MGEGGQPQSINLNAEIHHAAAMSKFLQVARYVIAGLLILLSSWLLFTNITGLGEGGVWSEGIPSMHYLYMFIGYGLALLVLMLTPAGLKES